MSLTSLLARHGPKQGGNSYSFTFEVLVHSTHPYAELIATFRKAEAEAAHKHSLIKAMEKKGPKAIQAATDTAAKAAKRRDALAKKLAALGVTLSG